MKDSFEDSVAQHVLERLLVQIDKGETITVPYTTYNQQQNTYSTQNQTVNVQDSIVGKVIQRLNEDKTFIDSLHKEVESLIKTNEFKDKVANDAAEKLISWLNEKQNSWYNDTYKNRDSFKKEVRTQVVKIVAAKQADKILESTGENK
jgi:hypothetical protein